MGEQGASNRFQSADAGFQAAVGIYVGAVGLAVAATAVTVSDGTVIALLSVGPHLFTVGTIAGAIYAWHRPGLAVRIGGYRPRIAVLSLPVIASLTAAVVFASFLPAAAAIVVGGSAILLSVLSHDRYVAAVTDDRPVATWVWQRPQVVLGQPVVLVGGGIVLTAFLLGVFTGSYPLQQLYLVVLGVLFLWLGYGNFDDNAAETADIGLPELHVHDAGLVIDGTIFARLVPWRSITTARLTDETLVIERRWWFDVHCDRDGIDDPEDVLEAIRRRCS